jgi:hypothetical protein
MQKGQLQLTGEEQQSILNQILDRYAGKSVSLVQAKRSIVDVQNKKWLKARKTSKQLKLETLMIENPESAKNKQKSPVSSPGDKTPKAQPKHVCKNKDLIAFATDLF